MKKGVFALSILLLVGMLAILDFASAWNCGAGCSAVFGGSNGNRCECVGTNYVCCIDDCRACCSSCGPSRCKGWEITSNTPDSRCGYVPPAPVCTPTNGGIESCDGADNDCDGAVDESAATVFTDLAYFSQAANSYGRDLVYTSPIFSDSYDFNVQVWTEDLNFEIYCYNSAGAVIAQVVSCCSNKDDSDDQDYFGWWNCTNANKIYVRVYEQDKLFSVPIGYDIDYKKTSCCDRTNGGIETCDGKDNDCDSLVDEGLICFNISNAYWANLKDMTRKISDSNIGDTVLMVIPGQNLGGKEINYTIYKDVPFWFDKKYSQASSYGYGLWTVNISGDLYFKAKIDSVENQSNILDVSSSQRSSFPQAVISSPQFGALASTDSPIFFMHRSYDEDDLLSITWDFGDGVMNKTAEDYSLTLTPGLGNTEHIYTTGGIYTVKLNASEMLRGASSIDSETIYVLQPGINLIPVISSPLPSQIYSNWVNFNAGQSFVVDCRRGPLANSDLQVGNLNCSYLHAPNTQNIPTNKYEIALIWTVRNAATGAFEFSHSGNWSTNYSGAYGVVEFSRYFPYPGSHAANLDLRYLPK